MTMDNISTSKIGHISGNFTNILVFGGSYAALSFINYLNNSSRECLSPCNLMKEIFHYND